MRRARTGSGSGRRMTVLARQVREADIEELFEVRAATSHRADGFYRALGWRPTGETDAHGDEVLVLSQPTR